MVGRQSGSNPRTPHHVTTPPSLDKSYRNVWSAAVLQAKTIDDNLVGANVFGL